jgi:acyl-CoA thioesterase
MFQFDAETRTHADGPDRFSGHLNPSWSIGANPNGGYLLSMAMSALRQLVPQHPDPLTVTVHYLRPGLPDQPCTIEAKVLRTGRTLSTCRATLIQDGAARFELMCALGDLGEPKDPARLSPAAPTIPAPELCSPRSAGEQGVPLPLLERLDIRLHPNEAQAGAAGQAQVTGWIRFRDGRPPDAMSLLLFADTFPPSVFGLLGSVGWVPTVELTIHVRRRPAPGWILGQFRTEDLSEGRMIENGLLWDSTGQLVAQARQLALVRTPG